MKKILAILAVCILLGGMSTVTAISIPETNVAKNDIRKDVSSSQIPYSPAEGDWTGEFWGAFGELKKVDGEWDFT